MSNQTVYIPLYIYYKLKLTKMLNQIVFNKLFIYNKLTMMLNQLVFNKLFIYNKLTKRYYQITGTPSSGRSTPAGPCPPKCLLCGAPV